MEKSFNEIWLCKVVLLLNNNEEHQINEEFVVTRTNIKDLNACDYLYGRICAVLHYKKAVAKVKTNAHGFFFIKRIKWIKKVGNTNS